MTSSDSGRFPSLTTQIFIGLAAVGGIAGPGDLKAMGRIGVLTATLAQFGLPLEGEAFGAEGTHRAA